METRIFIYSCSLQKYIHEALSFKISFVKYTFDVINKILDLKKDLFTEEEYNRNIEYAKNAFAIFDDLLSLNILFSNNSKNYYSFSSFIINFIEFIFKIISVDKLNIDFNNATLITYIRAEIINEFSNNKLDKNLLCYIRYFLLEEYISYGLSMGLNLRNKYSHGEFRNELKDYLTLIYLLLAIINEINFKYITYF